MRTLDIIRGRSRGAAGVHPLDELISTALLVLENCVRPDHKWCTPLLKDGAPPPKKILDPSLH